MDLFAVLLTGLLAGGVSCAAVQGGLLAGLVTRQHRTTATATPVSGSEARIAAVTARTPSAGGRFADDLVPVTGFLAGKLLSHTLLGALIGAVGAAVRLSVGVRSMVQITAGVMAIVCGMGMYTGRLTISRVPA